MVPLASPDDAAFVAVDEPPADEPDALELDELPHPDTTSANTTRSAAAADARRAK